MSENSNLQKFNSNELSEVGESFSQIMISLLERRYLSILQRNINDKANQFTLEQKSSSEGQVFLREVLEIGRQEMSDEMFKAVPYILAACHDPGNVFISAFFGTGNKQHIYLGGKKISNQYSTRNITDYLSSVYSAFKSFDKGLYLGESFSFNGADKFQALRDFIKDAKFFSVLTGIPSNRDGLFSLNYQGLDRLNKAAGDGKFTYMVVAEPITAPEVDFVIDVLRKMKSEIHTLIRSSKSYTEGSSDTVTTYEREKKEDNLLKNLPGYLALAEMFVEVLIPGISTVNRVLSILQAEVVRNINVSGKEQLPPNSIASTKNFSKSSSIEVFDAHAEAVDHLLNAHLSRLQSAKGNGWWNTAVYVAAQKSETLNNVIGALKSLCSGDKTYLDPIRELKIDTNLVKEAMLKGDLIKINFNNNRTSHPMGYMFNCLSTCINSNELSILSHIPVKEMPGLPIRGFSKFSLSAPQVEDNHIYLGDLCDGMDRKISKLNISLESLNLHTLVAGMPGFGKTTTCMQIISEAYLKYQIPFLVIEPAKKEYRQLIRMRSIQKELRVYSIGNDSPTPLRINPFEFIDGVSLSKHIDMLKAVFNASFPMFAGMNYVLEDAIIAIYQEKGWNIYTSENIYLKSNSICNRLYLMPTLSDLLEKIEVVLSEKKYGQEIHQNLGAALRSRIKSLTVLTKGEILNVQRSIPLDSFLEKPTVIELQDLGDDQEKSFVMALLLVQLYEHAELKQKSNNQNQLQHLTLIEEAHRLLGSSSGTNAQEMGDARSKAIAMFTDILAEIRAYGEGLIIADQIPTKLASEILKNTNLKIIHRLNAPDDRITIGRSLNLTEGQSNYLNNLQRSFAVVHDMNISDAVLVKVNAFKDDHLGNMSPEYDEQLLEKSTNGVSLSYLKKHSGCEYCPSPCSFFHYQESIYEFVNTQDVLSLLDSLYFKALPEIKIKWSQVCSDIDNITNKFSLNARNNTGITFCLLVNLFYKDRKKKTNKKTEQNLILEEKMSLISHLTYLILFQPDAFDVNTFKELTSQLEET